MKLRAMFAIAALLLAGCGSDGSVNNDTPTDGGGSTTDTPTGPTGGDGSSTNPPTGDTGPAPTNDGGATDTDGGTTGGDQDGGTTGGDQDSGTGTGGDQDGGATTGDSGSGGSGDQDGGTTGGGDQDGGVTTGDSGSGGVTTGDSGSGGGTTDGGNGGGDTDGGSGGGDDCQGHTSFCTYTQGYYKNHSGSVTALTLGGVSYSASDVQALLAATPNGDDSIILAKQLVAALLNGGACDPNASATVAAAQSWMAANKDADGHLPYGTFCVNQSDPGCTALSLGQTLDNYNSGNAGTPHCQ